MRVTKASNQQTMKGETMSKHTTIDADAIAVPHDGSKIDRWSIAAQFAINGLDGYHGKMTAAAQRKLLGGTPFGRKTVRVDCSNQGRICLVWRSSCGTDSNSLDLTFDELAKRLIPPAKSKLISIL